jgi:CelD/BcsL family acetyltransferase involved in cellulose biosynthesis
VGDRGEAERIDGSALDDPVLVAEWRRLAELRANPFLTPEWYRACVATETESEPFPIAWRRDGEIRGVLPLLRTRAGRVRTLHFAGSSAADWLGPACREEDEAAMAAGCAELLVREKAEWRLFDLTRIESGGAWPEALWGSERVLAPAWRRPRADVLPFIRFDEGGYDAYLAGRSRNFRSQLGRRRRRLEREHGLELRMTTERESLGSDLETFFRLHEERWAARGGSSALSSAFREAHGHFAADALARGWLRLWTADVDGEPGASWYGWRIGWRYCYALSGLRTGLEPLALGTVLLAHTIEQAAGEGASVYDLMRGDEDYKKRYETGRRSAGTWALGRRGHPVTLARGGVDRLAALARAMPDPLRDPLKRVYRRVGGH